MRHCRSLRDGRHRQLEGDGDADESADCDGDEDKIEMLGFVGDHGRDYSDEHAQTSGPVAPARGFNLTHPLEREDEEDRGEDVEITDDIGCHLASPP